MHPLREARESRGLTQAALGRKARIHPATISHIEHGRLIAWPSLIRRLSKALGVSPDQIGLA